MGSKEREVYFAVVRFVLQMLHFAVGVLDERSLFGQTLYMLQYQSGLPWKQWGKTEDDGKLQGHGHSIGFRYWAFNAIM